MEDPGIPRAVPIWFGLFLVSIVLAAVVQDDATGWITIAVFLAAPAWALGWVGRYLWCLAVTDPDPQLGPPRTRWAIPSAATAAAERAGGWRCDVLASGEDSGSVTYDIRLHGPCWTGSPLTPRAPSSRIHGCVVLWNHVASF